MKLHVAMLPLVTRLRLLLAVVLSLENSATFGPASWQSSLIESRAGSAGWSIVALEVNICRLLKVLTLGRSWTTLCGKRFLGREVSLKPGQQNQFRESSPIRASLGSRLGWRFGVVFAVS